MVLEKLVADSEGAKAVQDRAPIAPITNHELIPVTSIHDVSHMAGFNNDMEQVVDMVVGDQDALVELEVDDTFHMDDDEKRDWCRCL